MTVAEYAVKAEVSVQTVYRHLKSLKNHKGLTCVKGGKTVITAKGVDALNDVFNNVKQKFNNVKQNADNPLYEILRTELEAKNKLIEEQQKTINELTATVKSQAQSINADRHNELAETLQQQITASKDEPLSADDIEAEKSKSPTPNEKRSFWSGIFGKKKGNNNND